MKYRKYRTLLLFVSVVLFLVSNLVFAAPPAPLPQFKLNSSGQLEPVGDKPINATGGVVTQDVTATRYFNAIYAPATIYVSPTDCTSQAACAADLNANGNDVTGDGSAQKPFATLHKAADYLMQKTILNDTGYITIKLAKGKHPSSSSSYTKVCYFAHPQGHRVRIIGTLEEPTTLSWIGTPSHMAVTVSGGGRNLSQMQALFPAGSSVILSPGSGNTNRGAWEVSGVSANGSNYDIGITCMAGSNCLESSSSPPSSSTAKNVPYSYGTILNIDADAVAAAANALPYHSNTFLVTANLGVIAGISFRNTTASPSIPSAAYYVDGSKICDLHFYRWYRALVVGSSAAMDNAFKGSSVSGSLIFHRKGPSIFTMPLSIMGNFYANISIYITDVFSLSFAVSVEGTTSTAVFTKDFVVQRAGAAIYLYNSGTSLHFLDCSECKRYIGSEIAENSAFIISRASVVSGLNTIICANPQATALSPHIFYSDNASDLVNMDVARGDFFYDTDDDKLYYYTGSTWLQISTP